MNRRKLLQYLTTFSPVASTLSARAQDVYPSKPIRVITTSAPGALLDSASRLYAERMSVSLKQPVIVENMPGAGGLLAVRYVVKSPADGYTLLAAANTVTTLPYLNAKAGYSMKELTAVGEMARSPVLLVVSSGSPFRSVADIVATAKQNPRQVSFASGGVGTTSHLPAELFARQAGIALTHVPYKGNSLAVPDVAAGRVSFMMGTPTSLVELMKSGALRALAVSSDTRSPTFPDVPTFKELGLDETTFDVWVGLLAPAATTKPVRAKLGEAMEAARRDPNIIKRVEGMGQTISDVRTPEKFEAVLRSEEEKYRKLIKNANIVGS